MTCDHPSQIRIESRHGFSKILCADCLEEMRRELTGTPVDTAEGDEPYTQEAVAMLKAGKLTEWEDEFIHTLGKMRQITPKQRAIWTSLVRKYFPKGLAGCDLSQGSEDLDLGNVPF